MDPSCHTVTKFLSDEKTHGAINTNVFKRLDHINDHLYEVELAKAKIEHRKPTFVGFFILQYAKLRMLELYYNFFGDSATSTKLRSWNWTLIFGIWLCMRKSCTITFEKNLKLNGN